MYIEQDSAFLDYWKKGVKKTGVAWFDLRVDAVDKAVDKNQLRPNRERIEEHLFAINNGTAVFLLAMYSFFNSAVAQEMLIRLGCPNIGDIVGKIDSESREIVSGLCRHYAGW